ncbi:MAG: hypothetical protein QXS41_04065, partial [Candidatus Woesearchaeota archaeon]
MIKIGKNLYFLIFMILFVLIFVQKKIYAPVPHYICTISNSNPVALISCSELPCESWSYTDVGCSGLRDKFYCPSTGETYCTPGDCSCGGNWGDLSCCYIKPLNSDVVTYTLANYCGTTDMYGGIPNCLGIPGNNNDGCDYTVAQLSSNPYAINVCSGDTNGLLSWWGCFNLAEGSADADIRSKFIRVGDNSYYDVSRFDYQQGLYFCGFQFKITKYDDPTQIGWIIRLVDDCSSCCINRGFVWFDNLGSWSYGSKIPACCGNQGSIDNFATYSGSLTSSQSVSCRRCNAGSDQGTSTLYGNGYWTENTCYYGDITCTASSAAHGESIYLPCTEGNSYCLRTDFSPERCYYNVGCWDGGYNQGTYHDCPPTQYSGGICYYNRACTSSGCQYNSQNLPPNQPSSITINPSCAGSSTTVTVSATVSDPDGDQVKLQACTDVSCSTVLCTSSAVSSGSSASCQFTASNACSSTGSCTIYVRTIENSVDDCGEVKVSSTVSSSFNYDISEPSGSL